MAAPLGKIGFGLLILFWLMVLIALIVDELVVNTDVSGDDYSISGATEARFDVDGFSGTTEYAELCDDFDSDEYCELESKGIIWIIFNVITLITGLICILAGVYYEFKVLPLAILFRKKVVGIACCAISGAATILACLIYVIDNPLLDDKGFNSEDNALGASWILALLAGIGYLACLFFFLKVFDGVVPDA